LGRRGRCVLLLLLCLIPFIFGRSTMWVLKPEYHLILPIYLSLFHLQLIFQSLYLLKHLVFLSLVLIWGSHLVQTLLVEVLLFTRLLAERLNVFICLSQQKFLIVKVIFHDSHSFFLFFKILFHLWDCLFQTKVFGWSFFNWSFKFLLFFQSLAEFCLGVGIFDNRLIGRPRL